MGLLITRRRVLAGLGVAAGAAGIGGYSLTFGAPAPGATVLSSNELAVVRAIAEVWFPAGIFPVDGIEADVAGEVDASVADLLDPVRLAGFRYVLRALEWGTFASRGARFTALDAATRLEVLRTWGDPSVLPRRVATDSLKALLGIAYFSHPAVLAAIGWKPGCDDEGV
ncbi:MAG: gluconate 2-dehydrogenase subunit 3 family protein [Alphaproteobacteria bacterium]|nr:gluconate 2-dehydrogenase subunit 3 family protein [Alphaproteobacteria bacterium]